MPTKDRVREDKQVPFYLIKADAALGIVESIVSVMGIIDLGEDIIWNGAYVKTISERRGKIRTLDNHNTDSTLRVVGKPLEMREVGRDELATLAPQVLTDFPEATGGLYCKTQFLIETPEGLGVFQRIAANAINEWSIGYDALDVDRSKVVDPKTGKEIIVRNIRTIRLWEYSPVIWGMNQATAVVSAKDLDMPTSKGQADAGNYRSVENTAANRCASCAFYRELNDTQGYCKRFDFVAGANMLCDAYKAGKSDDPGENKEFTEDGGQGRLGDYLVAKTYGIFMEVCTDCLQDGMLSDTEHRALVDLGAKLLDMLRNGMTPDVAYRPYSGGMDMFYLWGADGGDESKLATLSDAEKAQHLFEAFKAGRVLSAKNATKISAAVDSLLEVLITAGVYTSVDDEPQVDEPGKSAGAGSQKEAPTNFDNAEIEALEAELLELEIGGITSHA